jgi:hypothetical protein
MNTLIGQELILNESVGFYEYTLIKESSDSSIEIKFKNRLNELNYKNVNYQDNFISGEGMTNHLVGGFATVEIKYLVKVSFKQGKYKLTITNFVLTDKNGSNPIEGMGSFKNKWVRIINEKLPEIVNNIQSLKNEEDW